LADFLPEFYFADFFTLSQGFSFVKINSNALFCGIKLTNLGEISLIFPFFGDSFGLPWIRIRIFNPDPDPDPLV
jgi:hypothetical protein